MGFASGAIASLKYTRSLRRKVSFFKTPKTMILSNESYQALHCEEKRMETSAGNKKMLREKRERITRRERLRDFIFLGIGLALFLWLFWNLSF